MATIKDVINLCPSFKVHEILQQKFYEITELGEKSVGLHTSPASKVWGLIIDANSTELVFAIVGGIGVKELKEVYIDDVLNGTTLLKPIFREKDEVSPMFNGLNIYVED